MQDDITRPDLGARRTLNAAMTNVLQGARPAVADAGRT